MKMWHPLYNILLFHIGGVTARSLINSKRAEVPCTVCTGVEWLLSASPDSQKGYIIILIHLRNMTVNLVDDPVQKFLGGRRRPGHQF